MKHNFIRYSLIVLLSGIVALPTGQAQAQTEQTREVTLIQDLAPVGLAYGQSLRINVLNPLAPAPPGEDGQKSKMLFAVILFAADGRVIARSDEVTLDPGEFHSFDFKRADLPLAGEPGTGRLQTHAQIRYRSFYLVDRTRAIGFSPTSIELIDGSTGKTTAVWVTVGFFEVVPPRNPQ